MLVFLFCACGGGCFFVLFLLSWDWGWRGVLALSFILPFGVCTMWAFSPCFSVSGPQRKKYLEGLKQAFCKKYVADFLDKRYALICAVIADPLLQLLWYSCTETSVTQKLNRVRVVFENGKNGKGLESLWKRSGVCESLWILWSLECWGKTISLSIRNCNSQDQTLV